MRRFVVIGKTATASDDFRIDDLPGTSGRLDVLLRCIRAALLVSHGVRRDAVIYLVLGSGPRAPRTLRVSGAGAKFIRPDERSLGVLAQKILASRADEGAPGFVEIKAGIALSRGSLADVLADLEGAAPYVLVESGVDIRSVDDFACDDAAFFLGAHVDFDDDTRAALASFGARPLSVGPVGLHAEDAIAIVSNEVDRRQAARR